MLYWTTLISCGLLSRSISLCLAILVAANAHWHTLDRGRRNNILGRLQYRHEDLHAVALYGVVPRAQIPPPLLWRHGPLHAIPDFADRFGICVVHTNTVQLGQVD